MKKINIIALLLLSQLFTGTILAQKSQGAKITIQVPDADERDSVRVIQYSFNLLTPETRTVSWKLVKKHQITIRFENMVHPEYFSIYIKKQPEPSPVVYMAEPGDSITIVKAKNTMLFSGKGYAKMKCRYAIYRYLTDSTAWFFVTGKRRTTIEHFDFRDICLQKSLQIVETYRQKISKQAYFLLKADIWGEDLNYLNGISNNFGSHEKVQSLNTGFYDSLYKRYSLIVNQTNPLCKNELAGYSYYLPMALMRTYLTDSFYRKKTPFHLPKAASDIKKNYKGLLGDLLLTILLHNFNGQSDSLVSCIREALAIVKDNELSAVLHKQYLHYLQGAKAFNFSLRDTSGRLVRLTDFAGKNIVIDIWYTGCLSCVSVSTVLRKIEPIFKNSNLVFLSISIDRDINTWKKSVKGGHYTAPGRINLYTDQRGPEDPFIKYYDIFGYPTLMMINSKGTLVSARIPDPRNEEGKLFIEAVKAGLK